MSYPLVSIKDFCTTSSGGTPSRDKPEYYNGSIPWIKSGDLRENLVTEATEFLSEDAIQNSSAKIVKKGALLLAMYGATVGRMAILGIDAATNQAVCSIVPDESKAFPKYVYYALLNKAPEFLRNAVGGAQPNINQGIIKETQIPLPPLAEQKRIAAILDKADAIRRKRQQSIQLADDFLRSVFLDMFGDPVTNPKIDFVTLDTITNKITDGVHLKPTYTEAGVPFISVKDITTGELIMDNCKFISEEDHLKYTKRCKPERGDILYTKVGATYGRPALINVDTEFSLYVSVCLIKPKKDLIDPHFLKMVLGSSLLKNQADKRIKGIGVPDLHLDQIKQFVIPLPNMDLQLKLKEKIEHVEQMKSRLNKSLLELTNSFNSLSQKAFSGQL